MADYKELYLKLFRANAAAINMLIEAQNECEEMYISSKEPKIVKLSDIIQSEQE